MASAVDNGLRSLGTIQKSIESKLKHALNPGAQINVVNESHMHRGHAGIQGVTSTETHFKITVVAPIFTNMTRLERQRLVNKLLKDEFDNGLHAIAMECKSPLD